MTEKDAWLAKDLTGGFAVTDDVTEEDKLEALWGIVRGPGRAEGCGELLEAAGLAVADRARPRLPCRDMAGL